MHENGIFHGCLKAENILCYPENCQIKLITEATAFKPEHLREYKVLGNKIPYWITPEIINETTDKKVQAKDDIWALGCIAYEMASNRAPYADSDDNQSLLQSLKHSEAPRAIPDAENRSSFASFI